MRSVADKLSHLQQKKSLIYFSSGMDRTGIENQSELRAATNAAVRANMAICTGPAGTASGCGGRRSAERQSPWNVCILWPVDDQCAQLRISRPRRLSFTLSSDTGGRAFLDSNDFSHFFRGVQQDTSTYYMLGYHSTNLAKDGRYRRISVKVKVAGVKAEYRRGYYAPADYRHSGKEDKELQPEEGLASDLPATDLPLYLGNAYFRLDAKKFLIPISLVVPGSEIPFTRNSDRDKATLDVIGMVLDGERHPVTRIRDTVKIVVETSSEVRKKNVQYDTGISLPPGKYHLKFLVRENQTGRMGSFETDREVPDLESCPLKMSSIVLASQVQPAKKGSNENPLVREGAEIVPNVTHVFSTAQHLRLYYEVYEPGRENPPQGSKNAPGVHLLTNVEFLRGKTKVFESSAVELWELNVRDRKAGVFQLDLPLNHLKPGFYTCQVNVIDDAAGVFLFPRIAVLIRADTSAAVQ